MNLRISVLALTMVVCAVPLIANAQRRLLPIDDFDGGIQNLLGGYRNTFEKLPSSADAMRDPAARHGRGGMGLRITADRKAEGFCGYWIHFFDMRSQTRRYVDANDYRFLSFWVRGVSGEEKFTIKIADQRWTEKEDSVAVGAIDEFLPDGVTTAWQEVLVPLDAASGLSLDRLGGVTFDFDTVGKSTVFIDNLSLKSSRSVAMVEIERTSETGPVLPESTPALKDSGFDRALWLWSTERMLDDPSEADALFRFCSQQGVGQIWAQLLYDLKTPKNRGPAEKQVCVIQRESAMRRFLKAAHQLGIDVHALEGYPEHAQRDYHDVSLAIVDAVIEFNAGQPDAEQFDGIHFDNEPHLLLGWHEPSRREQILFEFLSLNKECQRRVRAAATDLTFGVDIPFWLQDREPRQQEPIGVVTFNGRRQAASYHLLEMLDNVGVMNYRDAAQGADGMIAHGRDLLDHADAAARAKVFMGVETFAYEPTQVLFAVGRPRGEFEQAIRSGASELARLSKLDGYRLRVFDDGVSVHVGIEVADAETVAQRIEIAKTISKIASMLGVSDHASQANLIRSLERSKDWSAVRHVEVRDPLTGASHLLVKADAIMPSKISFSDDNPQRFRSQVQAAESYFSKHSSYAGIAVHHYESFRTILKPRPSGKDRRQTVTLTSAN